MSSNALETALKHTHSARQCKITPQKPCLNQHTMPLNPLVNYIAFIAKCCIRRTKYIQLTIKYHDVRVCVCVEAAGGAET